MFVWVLLGAGAAALVAYEVASRRGTVATQIARANAPPQVPLDDEDPAPPPASRSPRERVHVPQIPSTSPWVPPAAPTVVPPVYTPAMTYSPTLESWRNAFTVFGVDIPIGVSMSWTATESGGNPCSVGETPQPGAAEPQEYGLAQLNAKDPTNLAIATSQSLRGMCGIGPSRAQWEALTRPLTEAEKIQHVNAAVGLMRHCRDQAIHTLGTSNAWGLVDTWRLAKCFHAAPAVAKLYTNVAKQLGRQPTWDEFKDGALKIALANGYSKAYVEGKVYANVEKFARGITQPRGNV